MEAENAFLKAVEGYLESQEGLSPAPAVVGVAEPGAAQDLPAVVLSLEDVHRDGRGMEAGTQTVTGALGLEARIDLGDPVLPDDPSVSLIDEGRVELYLPQGGLVRADGTQGPLGPGDIAVRIETTGPDGGPETLELDLAADGGENTFSVEPLEGRLRFDAPLSAEGLLVARYHVGQWEQRVTRIAGTLIADVCAVAPGDVRTLSEGIVEALLGPGARDGVPRLLAMSVSEMSSIRLPESSGANERRRTVKLSFRFEHVVDEPDSSGGIIRTVPVTTRVS